MQDIDRALLATTLAYLAINRSLLERWLATKPTPENVTDLIGQIRNELKNSHSNESLDPEAELFLVDKALAIVDQFFEKGLSIGT